MSEVTHAVIAAAGLGTRSLPATKAIPKEMLPIIDRPTIQYVVEELVEAGVTDIVMVTSQNKQAIKDHFSPTNDGLRNNLTQTGRHHLLEQAERVAGLANFEFVNQEGPYGNAAPVLSAQHLIGDIPFIYAFADDFVVANPSRFNQIMDVRRRFGGSVLSCIRAGQPEDYQRYGYVSGYEEAPGIVSVKNIVEKPGSAETSPSDLATVSGYLLDPAIFSYLRRQKDNLTGDREFMIQESMQDMVDDGEHIYGKEIVGGQFLDTGNHLAYLKTIVRMGLMREDIGGELRSFLHDIAND